MIRKKWKDKAPVFISNLSKAYSNAFVVTAEEFESLFQSTAVSLEINPGQMMQLFRVCLTGLATGPALFEMAGLLGASEVAGRLNKAIQILQKV